MQVGAAECRLILSYFWFDVGAGRSYPWSKIPLNSGRTVFDCRSLQVLATLHEKGFTMSLNGFKTALQRIRKERADAQPAG